MQEIDQEIADIKAETNRAEAEENEEMQNFKINKLKEVLAKHHFKELTPDEDDTIRVLNS